MEKLVPKRKTRKPEIPCPSGRKPNNRKHRSIRPMIIRGTITVLKLNVLYSLAVENEKLILRHRNGSELLTFKEGGNLFLEKIKSGGWGQLRFERDQDDRVTGFSH